MTGSSSEGLTRIHGARAGGGVQSLLALQAQSVVDATPTTGAIQKIA